MHGLSQAEAQRRLRTDGTNELPAATQRNILAIMLEVLREPMFLLLVSAGAIYLLLGDISDALMLLGFVFVVIGITVYQEYKTERVLEALRDLTSPRALVLRNGVERRIAGREVVRGDLLILAEGDRVPADAALVSCNDFAADESLLTGESVAVRKLARADAGTLQPPGGEDLPFVYSGTLVVGGRGMARVLATGAHTEIGKTGSALQELEIEATPLQQEIGKLVRRLAVIGALLSLLLLVIYGITRGDWLHGLLSGITLAMAILPEEYPVILTVFMAMGAWRISRHRVLTRRVPAVETLGSATVLCVDKTGTLTQNRMRVQQLVAGEATFTADAAHPELPEAFHELVEFGILASETDPFDPMEKAIHALGAHYLADTEHLHRDWTLAHEYPLSPQLLALSHVWQARATATNTWWPPRARRKRWLTCATWTGRNWQRWRSRSTYSRRRACACWAWPVPRIAGSEWPDIQHDFDFEFLGLIGLADPLRPTVKPALRECAAAGIRVVMITGDYPATAAAIAQQIGLDVGSGGIVSGAEFSQMDDAMLREHIRHCQCLRAHGAGTET